MALKKKINRMYSFIFLNIDLLFSGKFCCDYFSFQPIVSVVEDSLDIFILFPLYFVKFNYRFGLTIKTL